MTTTISSDKVKLNKCLAEFFKKIKIKIFFSLFS